MEIRKTAPAKVAQYYMLMFLNGMDSESAKKLVDENSYEELNKLTNSNNIIVQAKTMIESDLIFGNAIIEDEHFFGEVSFDLMYFFSVGDKLIVNFDSEEALCEGILKVAFSLYNEDINNQQKGEVVELDKLSKYLMIIAAIISALGYPIGKMQELPNGKFEPSNEIEKAYNRLVEKF